jgi:hypothetical protein
VVYKDAEHFRLNRDFLLYRERFFASSLPRRMMVEQWRLKVAVTLLLGCTACVSCYSALGNNKSSDSEIVHVALAPASASAGEKYIVIASEPRTSGIEREWIETHISMAAKSEHLPDIAHMVADYEERNAKEQLPTSLEARNLKIVSAGELARMFRGDVIGGWKRFRSRFPGADALIDLSLPGYSADRTWAVLTYSVARGSLSQEVWVALLHRQSGAWIVVWSGLLTQS